MTVATPLATRPIAPAPLVVHPVAPTDVSHPHVVSCPGQANGTSNSSSMLLPSHSTDAPSYFHVASHVAHPHIALYPVQSCASSAPPPTLPTSHSNVDISHAALSSPPQVASHVPPPHVASRPEKASGSSRTTSTPPPSRSTAHPTSAGSSPPRRKRSRRCFVCGGTGKHRLNPRFCPRTYELLSKHLATFDATFRLVSFDGSPLPMTRHPGGVAAHLLSPRCFLPRTAHASSRSVSKPPGGSHANPPHVPHTPHDPPKCVPLRVLHAVPIADLNPSHASPTATVHPRHIPSMEPTFESNPPHVLPVPYDPPICVTRRVPNAVPIEESNPPHASHSSVVRPHPIPVSDRSIESNLPHFPPVERLPSPPVYLPVPLPDSKPPADSSSEDSSPHISLSIFELLFISPPIRDELRKLIDAMDRSNVGHEIPSSPLLRKVFFRIFDRMVDLLSSPP